VGRAPKDLNIPDGCSLFAVIRDGVASSLRPDTLLREGDKVIAIGRTECEVLLHEQLIGEAQPAEDQRRRRELAHGDLDEHERTAPDQGQRDQHESVAAIHLSS
jgi:NhaP-type Na+/H+ and K+/H+ antiporter